jgi:ribosome recycling factor
MSTDFLSDAETRMKGAIESLKKDLAGIRTGRASPALVDRLTVEYYGNPTPLNQIANVSAPEPRLLVIQPWEKSSITTIEKAILKSDLGLTPSNDGRVIRLGIPQLTKERRADLVKFTKKRVEEGRIAIRNVRREGHDTLRAREKDKSLSEDDAKRLLERLQKLTDSMIAELDQVGIKKEQEITEV